MRGHARSPASDDAHRTSDSFAPEITKRLMSKKKATGKTSPAKAKATVSGPAHPGSDATGDVLDAKMAGTQAVAASLPYNATKANEYGELATRGPVEGAHVELPDPIVGASTVTESNSSAKVGSGVPTPGDNPTVATARSRPGRLLGSDSDHQSGRAGRRQPELAQGRPARADAARGLHSPRENHPLRSRAHPRADRARPRLGGARLLRVLRAADAHTRASLFAEAGKQTPVFVRFSTVSASAARPTPRAMSAASRSSSTPMKATGISSATTSRSSSSRTR